MTGARPMGSVDRVWLEMDRPTNLMVIDSLMWFDDAVDWDRLTEVIQRRLVDRYPVFRQYPVEPSTPLGAAHWADDPDFSIERHLRRVDLASPGDSARLQEYVESQMQRPLDRQHPLWEVHFLDGYHDGSAVLARFHHSLADGIALAQVLLALTDTDPDADLAGEGQVDAELSPWGQSPGRRFGLAPLRSTAGRAAGVTAASAHLAAQVWSQLPHVLTPAFTRNALTIAAQTGHIADKLLLGVNPDTPLSGTPGIAKKAVWARPRQICDIKSIGRLAGATVNDVLVGAVSGALGSYLVGRGAEPADLTAMIPVNLRPADRPLPRDLGNQFALVMLPLPSGLRTPLHRLSETKARMDSIKHSPEAVMTFGLLSVIGWASTDIARLAIDFFAAKTIGVMTNVVGPVNGRYMAGSKITGMLAWVPGSGRQTVGVCIVSYNHSVRVGFKVDASVVPDPEKLVHAFDDELDALLRIAAAG